MHQNILFLLNIFSFIVILCVNVEISENNGLPSYEKAKVDIPSIPKPGSVPVKKIDLTDPAFHTPITLTEEEHNLMRLNNPVVINYLARPEQMLVLMEH
eukprot:jgi/Antlo1/1458/2553